MRFRRKQDEPEIPTASMADIAFLLIVFFMLTSVFAETRGINFSIPPKDQEEEPDDAEREEAVSIHIDTAGQILLDKQTPVSRNHVARDLRDYLQPKLERWPEKPILVTADEDAPYGVFVEVYDGLRRVELDLRKNLGLPKMKISILSLTEIKRLKETYGEDIFG